MSAGENICFPTKKPLEPARGLVAVTQTGDGKCEDEDGGCCCTGELGLNFSGSWREGKGTWVLLGHAHRQERPRGSPVLGTAGSTDQTLPSSAP